MRYFFHLAIFMSAFLPILLAAQERIKYKTSFFVIYENEERTVEKEKGRVSFNGKFYIRF